MKPLRPIASWILVQAVRLILLLAAWCALYANYGDPVPAPPEIVALPVAILLLLAAWFMVPDDEEVL